MTFKLAGSHGINVTTTLCIQSHFMSLLIITVTFVGAIEARGQTQFYFHNIRNVFQIEGMLKVFNFLGMGEVFGTNQHIRCFQNSLESR